MDLTQIIMAILSGTTLGGIYEAVKYRKENKALKEAEAKNATTDAQGGQIDLANKYFDGMLEMLEKVKQSQDKGNDNQEQMIEKLNKLSEQTDKQEVLLNDIVTYLNGDFQRYLDEHQKRRKKGGKA